jgi:hypothetical protein
VPRTTQQKKERDDDDDDENDGYAAMMISAEPKANQTEPSRIAAFKSRR